MGDGVIEDWQWSVVDTIVLKSAARLLTDVNGTVNAAAGDV